VDEAVVQGPGRGRVGGQPELQKILTRYFPALEAADALIKKITTPS